MSNFVQIDNSSTKIQEYLNENGGSVEKNIEAREVFNNK